MKPQPNNDIQITYSFDESSKAFKPQETVWKGIIELTIIEWVLIVLVNNNTWKIKNKNCGQ